MNWNGWKDTQECIKSILLNPDSNYQILIVDNKSTDDSVGHIRNFIHNDYKNIPIEEYKADVKDGKHHFQSINSDVVANREPNSILLIQSDENLGYAGGNNIGLKFASLRDPSSYKLILNNDTCVKEDFLENLELTLKKNKKISLLGFPAFNYSDHNMVEVYYVKDRLLRGLQKVTSLSEEEKGKSILECESIGGHAMLITPDSPVQLLPEQFFLYCEESEFCQQVKKAQGKIYLSLNSKIYHKHSGTVGLNSPLQIYYYNRNIFYYMKSNRPWLIFILFLILKSFKSLIKIAEYVLKEKYTHARALFQAYIDFILGKRGKQWID